MLNEKLPIIRILPMDFNEEEFKDSDINQIQNNYFLNDLPNRNGKYLYRSFGLVAEKGTLVLFQFMNKIIASAIFIKAEKFIEPEKKIYTGALYFDEKSIKVFEPVSFDIVYKVWPNIKKLSNVKWRLNPQHFSLFEKYLRNIRMP